MTRPGRGVADRPQLRLVVSNDRLPLYRDRRDTDPAMGIAVALVVSVPIWWGLAYVAAWAWSVRP